MKNTLVFMVMFILSFVFSVGEILALDFNIIKRIVTNTPTPIPTLVINKQINIDLLKNVELVLSPTMGTKLTVTPTPTASQLGGQATPTLETKLTVTPNEEKIELSPTQEAIKTEEMIESKPDLKTWFMGITLGLLVLIIVIQAWPKKKISQ